MCPLLWLKTYYGLNFHPLMAYTQQWTSISNSPVKAETTSCKFFIADNANTSIGCPNNDSVSVYDSVFTSLDSRTVDVIKNHFTSRTIQVQPFQKQLGGKDCGLFSIAAITAIVYGEDPSQLKFIQAEMRNHLFTCFKNKCYDSFSMVYLNEQTLIRPEN